MATGFNGFKELVLQQIEYLLVLLAGPARALFSITGQTIAAARCDGPSGVSEIVALNDHQFLVD